MALDQKDQTKKSAASLNKEDYITNKVLFVVGLCLFGILYLMGIKRLLSYGNTFMFGYNLVRGIGVAAVIGCYLGYLKFKKQWKKGIDTTYMFFSGKNIMKFCAFMIFIHGYITYYYLSAIQVLYFILPAVAVLYVIFHVYQREFFVIALDCALGAGLLWIVGKGIANPDKSFACWIAIATMVLITFIQLALTFLANKRGGYLSEDPAKRAAAAANKSKPKDQAIRWKAVQSQMSVTDKQRQMEKEKARAIEMAEANKAKLERVPLFTSNRGRLILVATPLVLLVMILCAYFIFSNTYYLIFVVIAYFLVTAVYYTVKIL